MQLIKLTLAKDSTQFTTLDASLHKHGLRIDQWYLEETNIDFWLITDMLKF